MNAQVTGHPRSWLMQQLQVKDMRIIINNRWLELVSGEKLSMIADLIVSKVVSAPARSSSEMRGIPVPPSNHHWCALSSRRISSEYKISQRGLMISFAWMR